MSNKIVKEPLATDKTLMKLIQAIKDSSLVPECVDNLNSTSIDKPLSANQGRVLNNAIASLSKLVDISSDVTVSSTTGSINSNTITYSCYTILGHIGFISIKFNVSADINAGNNVGTITFSGLPATMKSFQMATYNGTRIICAYYTGSGSFNFRALVAQLPNTSSVDFQGFFLY